MKNIWILTLVILAALTACNNEPEIVIPQPPEFVRATASPVKVEYDKSTMISWTVLHAEYVFISVNGVTHYAKMGVKDSIEIKNLKETVSVEIVAYGEESLTSSKTVTVSVLLPPAPQITNVIAPSDSIPYGDKANFSWKIEGSYTKVIVDSVTQISNTFTTGSLLQSAEYTLTVVGPGGSTSTKVRILVGYWANSNLGLISYKPWMLKSMRIIQDGKVVFDSDLNTNQLTNLYYYPIGDKATVYNSSGVKFGSSEWSFVGENKISIDGSIYTFIITKDLFIRSETDVFNGKPAISEITYYRP